MFSAAQPFRPIRVSEEPIRPDTVSSTLADWLDGFPSPSTLQVSGSPSSGKSTFVFQLCLPALRSGQAIGWIDTGTTAEGTFHPLAALEAGEPLGKLLVVRVSSGTDALRAADLLLSCSGAVAALVVALPPHFRAPEAALVRLQRLAERSASHLIFLDAQPERSASLGAPIALRLCVQRDANPTTWASRLEITRHKGGPLGPLDQELHHGPDRLRLHRTL